MVRRKLVSLFMLSLLTAVFIISILVFGYAVITLDNMKKQNRIEAENVLNSASERIDEALQGDMQSSSVIANYGNIVTNFMMSGRIERLSMRDNLRAMLSLQLDLQSGLRTICVYSADGSRMFVDASFLQDRERTAAFDVCCRVIEDGQLRLPQRRTQLTPCYVWHDRVYYAIVAPAFYGSGGPYLGSLVFLYDGSRITGFLSENPEQPMVVMADGQIIASSTEEARLLWLETRGENWMQTAVSSVNWTLYTRPAPQSGTRTFSGLVRLCVVVLISTCVAFGILTAQQYRKIVGPILTIARKTAEIGNDPDKQIGISFHVIEYDELIGSINSMLLAQRKMSSEILRIQSRAYEEQISFLQSQINPHFLYNCLESIRGMAGMGRLNDVREMMSGVAEIYRYCSKPDSFSTLREERACAERYAKVMMLCYQNSFSARFELGEDTLDCPVPRMLLQPLIENAILHGFVGERRDGGTVVVRSVRVGSEILIIVENDGVGVSAEQLRVWNSGWEVWSAMDGTRIGLTNVMRRIWLLYGERAQVLFSLPQSGNGLSIQFCFPFDKCS